MRLKPKSTTKNPRALLYKRFTDLETAVKVRQYFKTLSTGQRWYFDAINNEFIELPQDFLLKSPSSGTPVFPMEITDNGTVLTYGNLYYYFNGTNWVSQKDFPSWVTGATGFIPSKTIGKYQLNKYYYAGSFDFMIKGMIEDGVLQYLKGNMIPFASMNIKFYSDDISLSPDDLVVVEGKLYSVESPSTIQKRQPKPFKIHFATLNNIL